MRVYRCPMGVTLAALVAAAASAQVANFTGAWQLSVQKSRWGKKPKPQSVTVKVEHNEPALSYHGTVVLGDEDSRTFEFTGAIDGKECPVTGGAYGPGKVAITRVNERTTTSVFKSDSGQHVETARTVVSDDGRTLTRRMQLKGPEGTISWTEVYERR